MLGFINSCRMEDTFARLHKAIDFLRDSGKLHTQQDIADALGMGKGNLSRALNGNPRYFTDGFIKRFAAAYSDYINDEWLLTGAGDMELPDKTMRPHFGAKAYAGFMCGVAEGEVGTLHPHIPGMRDYDFTIEAEGDSMMPRIESCDLLVCRKSNDRANPPIGKICVIDSKDGAVVKVIAAMGENGLLLHSLNPEYNDYNIDYSDILGIAEVIGMVRSF